MRALLVLFGLLVCASLAQGQQGKVAEAAPLPAQILTAKKVFVSNAGGDSERAGYSGGQDRAYNTFYAAVKKLGKYELAAAPADADLVFEICFVNPMVGEMVSGGGSTHVPVSGSGVSDPHFKLTILDPKTQVKLWVVFEHIEHAALQGNRDKNFDLAMNALSDDLKKLGAGKNP